MAGHDNIVELTYNNPLFGRFFRDLLREKKPNGVYFVHLARLSASTIEACVEQGVPIVFTATDFWMICPLYQLRLPDNSMCSGPNALSANCVRHYTDFLGQINNSLSAAPDKAAVEEETGAPGNAPPPVVAAVSPKLLLLANKRSAAFDLEQRGSDKELVFATAQRGAQSIENRFHIRPFVEQSARPKTRLSRNPKHSRETQMAEVYI